MTVTDPQPNPRSLWLGVVVGLAAVACGLAVVMSPSWPSPPVPPPPPPPPPAPVEPEVWPTTLLTSELTRPHPDPQRRSPRYRYQRARWLVFDDGLLLGAGHGEEPTDPDPCELASDEVGLYFPGGAEADLLRPGERPAAPTLAGRWGAEPYDTVGTLTVTRTSPDRIAATVDLAATLRADPTLGGRVSGAFTAPIVRCGGRPSGRPGTGRSGVHLALAGVVAREVEADLGFARVLAGIEGEDHLVFTIVPTEGCDPRPPGLFDVSAVWLLTGLPAGDDALSLVGGYEPGRSMVKTWTFVDGVGRSHNLGISGEIHLDERAADRLSGSIDARLHVPDGYPADLPVHGTLSGRFEADVVDCSEWKGPYPL